VRVPSQVGGHLPWFHPKNVRGASILATNEGIAKYLLAKSHDVPSGASDGGIS
jgi:hypothetical protein